MRPLSHTKSKILFQVSKFEIPLLAHMRPFMLSIKYTTSLWSFYDPSLSRRRSRYGELYSEMLITRTVSLGASSLLLCNVYSQNPTSSLYILLLFDDTISSSAAKFTRNQWCHAQIAPLSSSSLRSIIENLFNLSILFVGPDSQVACWLLIPINFLFQFNEELLCSASKLACISV